MNKKLTPYIAVYFDYDTDQVYETVRELIRIRYEASLQDLELTLLTSVPSRDSLITKGTETYFRDLIDLVYPNQLNYHERDLELLDSVRDLNASLYIIYTTEDKIPRFYSLATTILEESDISLIDLSKIPTVSFNEV